MLMKQSVRADETKRHTLARDFYLVHITTLTLSGQCEKFVRHHLYKPSITTEHLINLFYNGFVNMLFPFLKKLVGELQIDINGDGFKPDANSAIATTHGLSAVSR